jgi:hypothetical protein
MVGDREIQEMPIQQAVTLPGGNGLSSPAFRPTFGFLGTIGWRHVEKGTEAVVCDGQLIESTRLARDLRAIIGHRQFIRRVLLNPEPLEATAEALTSDQLHASLQVSIKYRVIDPVHVASTAAPVAELTNAAQGVLSEFIRSKKLTELIEDSQGLARDELRNRLAASSAVAGHFEIIEVLKALVSGDEGLVDVGRKVRVAEAEADLVDAEGRNAVAQALFDIEIAQGKAELEDELAQREHRRRMETLRAEQQGEVAREAIRTMGQVLSAGMDGAPLRELISGSQAASGSRMEWLRPRELEQDLSSAGSETKRPTTVQDEEAALDSIVPGVGAVAYDVYASGERITGATLQMRGYEIVFTCDEDYPRTGPVATVRFADGSTRQLETGWIPGFSRVLAQTVPLIVAKIQADFEPGREA